MAASAGQWPDLGGDAMEVLIAGFVLPGVIAAFSLQNSAVQQTRFLSAPFTGMFVGALAWGAIADRFGRRNVFLLTVLLNAISGSASALAPSYDLLVVFRFLTGFAVGGTLPVGYSLLAEYVPAKDRGRFLVYLESFRALGTIAVAAISWFMFARFVPAEGKRSRENGKQIEIGELEPPPGVVCEKRTLADQVQYTQL